MAHLLPFLLFSLVASITPGPTNILVLSHGTRYGLCSALPLVWGGCAAASSMILLVGFGSGQLLQRYPHLRLAMAWVGVIWLCVMALKLWRAAAAPVLIETSSVAPDARPGRASTTAVLQLVNPKSWLMALTVSTVFATSATTAVASPALGLALLALLFLLISLPCMTLWAAMGSAARRLLPSARGMARFNRAMAALLLAAAWMAAPL
jgi:threonine/homoserine/homoserine lactone efflux protein